MLIVCVAQSSLAHGEARDRAFMTHLNWWRAHPVLLNACSSASKHLIQLCSSHATKQQGKKQQGNKPEEDQHALAARLAAASLAAKALPLKVV